MDSTPIFPLSLPPCSPAPSLRLPFRHYNLFFHKGKGGFWPREGGSRGRKKLPPTNKEAVRMASKAHRAFMLLSIVMASLVAGSMAGVYHIVGAGKGWRMAPNKTYYEDWARTRNISIGDKLSKFLVASNMLIVRDLCLHFALVGDDVLDVDVSLVRAKCSCIGAGCTTSWRCRPRSCSMRAA